MPIRQSIKVVTPRIPWELEYALQCVNGGYKYGEDKTTVENLLAEAERWDSSASSAIRRGNDKTAGVFSRHAFRYLHAAALLEKHYGRRT